jgi:hypothetical protein
MVPIIRRRGLAVWEYIRTNNYVMGNLLKHMDTPHIADLVEKLILLENSNY